MENRRYLSVVAAAATLLAATPLWSVFERLTWFFECLLAVALIACAATLARSLRAPVWAQVGSSALALLLALTWMFPSHREILGFLPGPGTFEYFGQLLRQSVTDIRELGVPVPDGDSLLFLAVLGIGFVAICVDLFTVGLRRPALAGLPMLAIYSVPVAVYADSVPILPFVIGACGFLWLLSADNVDRVRRFGRRFTGDGRNVDMWEPSPLAAAGRRLAVIGVALAVALPLAVPGMTTGLIDRFGTGGGGADTGGGTGSSINLLADLSGQLRQDGTQELARVRTNEADPFYLRFGVAEAVTARGFAGRQPSGRPAARNLPSELSKPAGVTQTRYRATVEVTGLNMNLLPVYTQPVSLRGVDSKWYYDNRMQVIYSTRATSKGQEYTFDYIRSEYSPDALRAVPLDTNGSSQGAYLTGVPPVREIQTTVDKLIAGKENPYDRVMAIFNFFSRQNGFSYSLQTKSGTSGSAIVDFLTNKTGFCEQYAAAMAWLVRQAGIPARVAFGFTRGTQTDGDVMVLTNRNLHAWTEVFFEGVGWVPFDATPAASVPGTVDPDWARNPDAAAPASTAPTSPSDEAETEAGAADAGDPEVRDPFADGPSGTPLIEPNRSTWVWWVLGLTVIVLGLVGLPAARRGLIRRRRRPARAPRGRPAPANAAGPVAVDPRTGERQILVVGDSAAAARVDAHAAWDELLDTMVDFRIAVDTTETPRATAERLVRTGDLEPAAADGVRLLGRAEERARYARDPLSSEHLVGALRTVRRAVARRATRRTRIVAMMMPPSILRQWRLAVVEGASLAVTTLGRWQAGISPRRLLPRRG